MEKRTETTGYKVSPSEKMESMKSFIFTIDIQHIQTYSL